MLCNKKKHYWASRAAMFFFSNSAHSATFRNGLFPSSEEVKAEEQKNVRNAKMVPLFVKTTLRRRTPIKTGSGMGIHMK
jgi:hypothetical protein